MHLISTTVTFPKGAIEESANILSAQQYQPNPDLFLIITDKTPFHPIDFNWPDQPGDKGYMLVNDTPYEVVDSITVAYDPDEDKLYFDQDIKAHKHKENMLFCVGHLIKDSNISSNAILVGEKVHLKVDEHDRNALSIGHSLCHIAALALNKVLQNYWRKEIIIDSLGNPDFDKLAITKSKIIKNGSVDRYRLGKSLRKKGLNTEAVFTNLAKINNELNDLLHQWLRKVITIKVLPGESLLNDKRIWQCELLDGTATIPCGGTHVKKLSNSAKIQIKLEKIKDIPEILMTSNIL